MTAGAVVPIVLTLPKAAEKTNSSEQAEQALTPIREEETEKYEITHGTSPENVQPPPQKVGYLPPVLDATNTTYSEETDVGTDNLQIAFIYKSTVKSVPDLIVIYKVKIKKPDPVYVDLSGTTNQKLVVIYGSPLSAIATNDKLDGHKNPVLLIEHEKTTYKPNSPVGSNTTAAFRFESDNANDPDQIRVYRVEVTRAAEMLIDWSEKSDKEVLRITYGTPLTNIAAPSPTTGYKNGTPLSVAPTTYLPTTPINKKGKIAFRYAPENTNLPDQIIIYAFEVMKGAPTVTDLSGQADKHIKVRYKTDLAAITAPTVQGFKTGTVLTEPLYTTYQSKSGVNSFTKIAFKHEANDENLPDAIYIYGVEVTKESDMVEDVTNQADKTIEVTYGTSFDSVPAPPPISGYKTPRRVIGSDTTYSDKQAVGSASKIAFKYEPEDTNLPAITYIYAVKTVRGSPRTEDLSTDPKTRPIEVPYGTPISKIAPPSNVNRPGYSDSPAPLSDPNTTYATNSPIGTIAKIAFKYSAVNTNNPELIVIYPIKVTRPQTQVSDFTNQSEKNLKVILGTAPSQIAKPPKKSGYKDPVIASSPTQTTYSSTSVVGSSVKIAFLYESENINMPDLIEIYTVQVTRPDDQIIKSAATATYGTPPDQIGKPAARTGYASPSIDTAKTTYTTTSPAGSAGLVVAWRMVNNNPSAADIVYAVNVTVNKQADQLIAYAATAEYGTPVDQIGKPEVKTGYAAPTLDTTKTTYTSTSPAGTTGLTVTWIMFNKNLSGADIIYTVTVIVTKQADQTMASAVTVAYGTPTDQIGKPSAINGYAAPALDSEKTTYAATSPAGAAGLIVAWRMSNNDPSAADIVYAVAVTIIKQADKNEIIGEITVTYSTPPDQIRKPADRSGFASPILDPASNSYTAQSPVGALEKYVVWKFVNNNASAADVIVSAPVRVVKGPPQISDFTNKTDQQKTVVYGTPPEQIAKPASKTGFKAPVLIDDPSKTTYNTTSPAKSKTKVSFKYENENANLPDYVEIYAYEVLKVPDQSIRRTATVKVGTPPEKIGKPDPIDNYEEPLLDASKTNYKASSGPGTSGLMVVWMMTNKNPSGPNIFYLVSVKVKRADTFSDRAEIEVEEGTDIDDLPVSVKPDDGYKSPTVESATDYSNALKAGSRAKVVYRFPSNNETESDQVVTIPVKVVPFVEVYRWSLNFVWRSRIKPGETQAYNHAEKIRLPENKALGKRKQYLNGVLYSGEFAWGYGQRMKDGDVFKIIYLINDTTGNTLKKDKMVVSYTLDTSPKEADVVSFFTNWEDYQKASFDLPEGYELANTAYYIQKNASYPDILVTESQAKITSANTFLRIVKKYTSPGRQPYYVHTGLSPLAQPSQSIDIAFIGRASAVFKGQSPAFYAPPASNGMLWSNPTITIAKYVKPGTPGYQSVYAEPNKEINESEIASLPVGAIIKALFKSADGTYDFAVEYEITPGWNAAMVSELEVVTKNKIVPTIKQYQFAKKPDDGTMKTTYETLKTELEFVRVEEPAPIPGYFTVGRKIQNMDELAAAPHGTVFLFRFKIIGTTDNAPLPPEKTVDHFVVVTENYAFKDSEVRKVKTGIKTAEIGNLPADLPGYQKAVVDEQMTTYNETHEKGQKNLIVVYRYDPVDSAMSPTYVAFPLEIPYPETWADDITREDDYTYTVGMPLPEQDEVQLKLPEGHLIRQRPMYYEDDSDTEIAADELISKIKIGKRFRVVYRTTIEGGYIGTPINVSINYTVRPKRGLITIIKSPKAIGKKENILDLITDKTEGSYYITYGVKGNGTTDDVFPLFYTDIYKDNQSVKSYWALIRSYGPYKTAKGFEFEGCYIQLVYISKEEEKPVLPNNLEDYVQGTISIGHRDDYIIFDETVTNPSAVVVQGVGPTANNYNSEGQTGMQIKSSQYLPAGVIAQYSGTIVDPVDKKTKPFGMKVAIRPKVRDAESLAVGNMIEVPQYTIMQLNHPKSKYEIKVFKESPLDSSGEFPKGKIIKYPALASKALPGTVFEVTFWNYPENDNEIWLTSATSRQMFTIVPQKT